MVSSIRRNSASNRTRNIPVRSTMREKPMYTVDSIRDATTKPFNTKGDRKIVVDLQIWWSEKPNQYISRNGVQPRNGNAIILSSLEGHKNVIISDPSFRTMYKLKPISGSDFGLVEA